MPILNAHYTVPVDTRVLIASADNMPQDVIVHEADRSESTVLVIGNETVTGANGLHLHSAETIHLTLRPNDKLYAYSTQGAPTVHVLQIQKND